MFTARSRKVQKRRLLGAARKGFIKTGVRKVQRALLLDRIPHPVLAAIYQEDHGE